MGSDGKKIDFKEMDAAAVCEIEGLIDELPRLKLRALKETLRRYLVTQPIKGYKLSGTPRTELGGRDDERARAYDKAVKQGSARRLKALFALYNVPEKYPEKLQWRQLALSLAAEKFPGVRTLERGIGGPSTGRQKQRLKTLTEFKRFVEAHPNLTRARAAQFFLKDNEADCAAVGFTESASLADALGRAEKNYPL